MNGEAIALPLLDYCTIGMARAVRVSVGDLDFTTRNSSVFSHFVSTSLNFVGSAIESYQRPFASGALRTCSGVSKVCVQFASTSLIRVAAVSAQSSMGIRRRGKMAGMFKL